MSKKVSSVTTEKLRDAIKQFPQSPGLYFMKDSAGTVLYVGKAKNLRSRVSSYFQSGADILSTRGPGIAEMLTKVAEIDTLETKNEVNALLQEARLIKDIRPPYNTVLTDDKTFPYLEITSRCDYPGVYITRKPKNNTQLIGPFTSAKDLRAALVELQKIFKFRTCNLDIFECDQTRKFFRPCLLYSIKQCAAPCADKISKANYKESVRDLVKFLNSKRSIVLKKLRQQMLEASENMEYEKAGQYKSRIRLIEKLSNRGNIIDNVQPEAFNMLPTEALDKLGKILSTTTQIRVIEGFDIAHISGSETVGSMVRFIDGKPFKAGYRRYKIKTVKGIDDYASLKEVIGRRYRRAAAGEELFPDVILIDGGKGQLNAAAEVLKYMNFELPRLVSIAKKEELLFVYGQDKPVRLPARNPARKLMQYIRDEAHRFAQHYHHLLRSKKLLGK